MIDINELERRAVVCAESKIKICVVNSESLLEVIGYLRQAEKDAARYRWLRDCKWNESSLCVATNPKESVKLGTDCPSGDRLDYAIDEVMQYNGDGK